MSKFIVFLALVALASCDQVNYRGPFFIWGPSDVEEIRSPALGVVNEETLLALYEKVKSVVIFVTNTEDRIDSKTFPELKKLTERNTLVYLPQSRIPHPQGDDVKVEVISLSGPNAGQDKRIKDAFERVEKGDGKGHVLGILASEEDDEFEVRRKRDVEEPTSTASPSEEPMQEDFIYKADGKAILYTTSAPILYIDLNTTADERMTVKELRSHGIVTVDEREQFWRLSVTFADRGDKTTLRFKFPMVGGYWSLTSVEVVDKDFNGNLTVVGDAPEAPIGFSHTCSRQLVFQNGLTNLTMDNVQVQPLLAGANMFSDAYNCIGFTTVPIWSGIFVSFIMLFGTSIGIMALMDIKTPNRFESSRSKQLTFTVQE